MNNIARIERKLEKAQQIADRYARIVLDEPDNFAYGLSLQSMKDEVERLQEELRLLKEERAVEVLELRFRGKRAESGSMPLHLVGELMKRLADALHESSYYRHYGKVHKKGRIPSDIIHLLDLRLADIKPGSTKLFVTGKLSPDLFGNSLLEESLKETVSLLQADTPDELADAVSEVGISSAKKLRDFLCDLSQAELELDIEWNTPKQEKIQWKGNRHQINRLSQSLEKIEVSTDKVWLEGKVVMLSLRGRLEIKGDDGTRYVCTFPQRLYETVRPFHIGDVVSAQLEVNTYINATTGHEKRKYKLLTMRNPEDFKGIEHL